MCFAVSGGFGPYDGYMMQLSLITTRPTCMERVNYNRGIVSSLCPDVVSTAENAVVFLAVHKLGGGRLCRVG